MRNTKVCPSFLNLPPLNSPRYLQDNRVACEMGLYYILHIAKLRNKNALQRLLPALGESPTSLCVTNFETGNVTRLQKRETQTRETDDLAVFRLYVFSATKIVNST